jgi:polyhydroxybutyrate depolymerase
MLKTALIPEEPMKRLAWLCLSSLLLVAAAGQAADKKDEPHKLDFGGLHRTYLLHLPAPLPDGPLPLVVALHGGAGTGAGMAEMSQFDVYADLKGFIVVYPDGTDKPRPVREMVGKQGYLTWNSGHCCAYAHDHDVDDVGFIRAVVAEVEKEHAVDPKRVYATGISNGAMMSYRLACEASDLFAAIAPVAGIIDVPECKPTRPVSVIDFQGTADEYVPMAGGVGKKAFDKEDRPPVQQSIDFWAKQDGCSVTVQAKGKDLTITNYGACDDGTAVAYYVVQGGGHAWPGGEQMAFFLDKPDPNVTASATIWDFFKQHPRP